MAARLFLNAEENGKVLVFDTSTNKLIHTIADLKAPHSAVYRSDSRKLFVVDGDDSAVKIYNGDTYQFIGQVKLEIDADSMGLRLRHALHVRRQWWQGGAYAILVYQRDRYERGQEDKGHKDRL